MNRQLIKEAALILALIIIPSISSSAANKQKVIDDLKAAFIGETTASAKYAAFAKKADDEGLHKIALLFEAASKAENIHAGNHKAALEQLGQKAPEVEPKYEVKSTKENLQDAIKGETYESETMYPDFISDGTSANVTIALISFNYAYKTELKHKALYENALANLQSDKVDSMPSQYQVCTTCGNTYENEGPARCGICMTSRDRFLTIK
jgi:rubrerythrin